MKTSVAKLLLVYLLIFSLNTHLPAQGSMVLVGCGSVIPGPLYGVWADVYTSRNPQVRVNYLPLGSAEAIKQITSGAADFGAGEIPISDEEMKATGFHIKPDTLVFGRLDILNNGFRAAAYVALHWAGPNTQWFPLAEEVFDHPLVFQGLAASSHGNQAITFQFGDLGEKQTFPALTLSPIGDDVTSSPNWPGLTAQGGSGIVKQVAETAGAIGYAELNTAKSGPVGIGLVQNANGAFIEASPETAAAACPPSLKEDMRMSLTNRPGDLVYPITGFSYMFVPVDAPSGDRSKALRSFLKFVFTDGQSMIASRGHLPLPPRIVSSVLTTLHLEN